MLMFSALFSIPFLITPDLLRGYHFTWKCGMVFPLLIVLDLHHFTCHVLPGLSESYGPSVALLILAAPNKHRYLC